MRVTMKSTGLSKLLLEQGDSWYITMRPRDLRTKKTTLKADALLIKMGSLHIEVAKI